MADTAEMVETATDPKTIPPAVFKNGQEVISAGETWTVGIINVVT